MGEDLKHKGEDSNNSATAGVGMCVEEQDGQIQVVKVLESSSAMEAGIRAGDALLSINCVRTDGMRPEDIVAIVLGRAGSTLAVEVLREGMIIPFLLVRKPLNLQGYSITPSQASTSDNEDNTSCITGGGRKWETPSQHDDILRMIVAHQFSTKFFHFNSWFIGCARVRHLVKAQIEISRMTLNRCLKSALKNWVSTIGSIVKLAETKAEAMVFTSRLENRRSEESYSENQKRNEIFQFTQLSALMKSWHLYVRKCKYFKLALKNMHNLMLRRISDSAFTHFKCLLDSKRKVEVAVLMKFRQKCLRLAEHFLDILRRNIQWQARKCNLINKWIQNSGIVRNALITFRFETSERKRRILAEVVISKNFRLKICLRTLNLWCVHGAYRRRRRIAIRQSVNSIERKQLRRTFSAMRQKYLDCRYKVLSHENAELQYISALNQIYFFRMKSYCDRKKAFGIAAEKINQYLERKRLKHSIDAMKNRANLGVRLLAFNWRLRISNVRHCFLSIKCFVEWNRGVLAIETAIKNIHDGGISARRFSTWRRYATIRHVNKCLPPILHRRRSIWLFELVKSWRDSQHSKRYCVYNLLEFCTSKLEHPHVLFRDSSRASVGFKNGLAEVRNLVPAPTSKNHISRTFGGWILWVIRTQKQLVLLYTFDQDRSQSLLQRTLHLLARLILKQRNLRLGFLVWHSKKAGRVMMRWSDATSESIAHKCDMIHGSCQFEVSMHECRIALQRTRGNCSEAIATLTAFCFNNLQESVGTSNLDTDLRRLKSIIEDFDGVQVKLSRAIIACKAVSLLRVSKAHFLFHSWRNITTDRKRISQQTITAMSAQQFSLKLRKLKLWSGFMALKRHEWSCAVRIQETVYHQRMSVTMKAWIARCKRSKIEWTMEASAFEALCCKRKTKVLVAWKYHLSMKEYLQKVDPMCCNTWLLTLADKVLDSWSQQVGISKVRHCQCLMRPGKMLDDALFELSRRRVTSVLLAWQQCHLQAKLAGVYMAQSELRRCTSMLTDWCVLSKLSRTFWQTIQDFELKLRNVKTIGVLCRWLNLRRRCSAKAIVNFKHMQEICVHISLISVLLKMAVGAWKAFKRRNSRCERLSEKVELTVLQLGFRTFLANVCDRQKLSAKIETATDSGNMRTVDRALAFWNAFTVEKKICKFLWLVRGMNLRKLAFAALRFCHKKKRFHRTAITKLVGKAFALWKTFSVYIHHLQSMNCLAAIQKEDELLHAACSAWVSLYRKNVQCRLLYAQMLSRRRRVFQEYWVRSWIQQHLRMRNLCIVVQKLSTILSKGTSFSSWASKISNTCFQEELLLGNPCDSEHCKAIPEPQSLRALQIAKSRPDILHRYQQNLCRNWFTVLRVISQELSLWRNGATKKWESLESVLGRSQELQVRRILSSWGPRTTQSYQMFEGRQSRSLRPNEGWLLQHVVKSWASWNSRAKRLRDIASQLVHSHSKLQMHAAMSYWFTHNCQLTNLRKAALLIRNKRSSGLMHETIIRWRTATTLQKLNVIVKSNAVGRKKAWVFRRWNYACLNKEPEAVEDLSKEDNLFAVRSPWNVVHEEILPPPTNFFSVATEPPFSSLPIENVDANMAVRKHVRDQNNHTDLPNSIIHSQKEAKTTNNVCFAHKEGASCRSKIPETPNLESEKVEKGDFQDSQERCARDQLHRSITDFGTRGVQEEDCNPIRRQTENCFGLHFEGKTVSDEPAKEVTVSGAVGSSQAEAAQSDEDLGSAIQKRLRAEARRAAFLARVEAASTAQSDEVGNVQRDVGIEQQVEGQEKLLSSSAHPCGTTAPGFQNVDEERFDTASLATSTASGQDCECCEICVDLDGMEDILVKRCCVMNLHYLAKENGKEATTARMQHLSQHAATGEDIALEIPAMSPEDTESLYQDLIMIEDMLMQPSQSESNSPEAISPDQDDRGKPSGASIHQVECRADQHRFADHDTIIESDDRCGGSIHPVDSIAHQHRGTSAEHATNESDDRCGGNRKSSVSDDCSEPRRTRGQEVGCVCDQAQAIEAAAYMAFQRQRHRAACTLLLWQERVLLRQQAAAICNRQDRALQYCVLVDWIHYHSGRTLRAVVETQASLRCLGNALRHWRFGDEEVDLETRHWRFGSPPCDTVTADLEA